MRRRVSFATTLALALALSLGTTHVLADPPASESSAPPANVVIGTAANDTAPVRAEPPTWLVLRDGSQIVGRVTALRPEQFVVIELPGGESRVVAWAAIARAGGASFPGGYVAYVPQPSPAERARAEEAAGRVAVEFVSTGERVTVSPGFVMRGSGIDRAFTIRGAILCRTRCVGYAEPGPIVFTVQGAVGRQGTFHLDVEPGGSLVRIRPASRVLDPLSRALYWSSPAVFMGGWSIVIYGMITGSGSLTRESTPIIVGGAVVTGTGLLTMIAGIAMYFANRPRLVSSQDGGDSARRARWNVGIAPLADSGVMGSFGATF